jgi:hypothetical protein
MTTISITDARENFSTLVDVVAESHDLVHECAENPGLSLDDEAESLSFLRGVAQGLMDLEEGREMELSDVKKRLGFA